MFTDSSIGIPACMLGQWPDLGYHTSADTLEVIDPAVLAFSSRTAALYVYTLSNLSLEDAAAIQVKAHESLNKRIGDIIGKTVSGKISKGRSAAQLNHVKKFYISAARDYRRVLKEGYEGLIEKEEAWIRGVVEVAKAYLEVADADGAKKEQRDSRVFRRCYKAPLHRVAHNAYAFPESKETLAEYQQLYREFGHRGYTIETLAQFYLDGKRSVSDIEELIICDTGVENCHILLDVWWKLLEQIELIQEV